MPRKTNKIETKWNNIPSNIEDYKGFLYLITNTITNQKYIGIKLFWSTTKKKISGRKNRKIIVKESDWKYYESSSDTVKSQIKKYGKENFEFDIIECFDNKSKLNYSELEYQVKNNVLTSKLPNGDYEYLNEYIIRKFYRTSFEKNEEDDLEM
jgi:hypothetical protein